MKVKELVQLLGTFDGDLDVCISISGDHRDSYEVHGARMINESAPSRLTGAPLQLKYIVLES